MRKKIFGLLAAMGGIIVFTACGDDVTVAVPAAQPMDRVYDETEEEQRKAESPMETLTPVKMDFAEPDAAPTQAPVSAEEENADVWEDVLSGSAGRVSITISAAGDVTMGNYLGQDYSYSFRQTYEKVQDDSYFFENVYDIFSADDMTLVNLEGPLTTAVEGRTEQTYCISGEPAYASILTAGSVEAVSMANNHRLDYYDQGTKDTVAAVEEQGIVWAYDANLGVYETKGIRIGYVSVNEVGQGAGVEKILQEGIAKLQEEGADLILACCHWGIEREYYPEDYQKSLGRKCIDWGADLVIGCHPHVIQGIEEYQGKYIVYSLGNFCFGANRNPADKDCIIFQQTFFFEDGERLEESEVRAIPCSVSSVSHINDYKPTPAEGSEAQRILDRLNEYSRDFGVQFGEDGLLKEE